MQDSGSGVAGWTLTVDGTTLTSGAAGGSSAFTWDGSGLGTGDHTLLLTAVDALGNSDSITVTVRLEAEPPVVPPVVIVNTSRTATPTSTTQALPHSQITLGGAKFASGVAGGFGLTLTARPTATGGTVTFGSVDSSGEAAAQAEGSPNLLWGLGALGLIGAITAVVLDERRKRKEEEARQLAEAQAKAAALNAAEEQKRVENYLQGQLIQKGLDTLRNAGGTAEEIARLRDSMNSNGYAATLAAISQRIGEERTRLVGEQLRNIEMEESSFLNEYQEVLELQQQSGKDSSIPYFHGPNHPYTLREILENAVQIFDWALHTPEITLYESSPTYKVTGGVRVYGQGSIDVDNDNEDIEISDEGIDIGPFSLGIESFNFVFFETPMSQAIDEMGDTLSSSTGIPINPLDPFDITLTTTTTRHIGNLDINWDTNIEIVCRTDEIMRSAIFVALGVPIVAGVYQAYLFLAPLIPEYGVVMKQLFETVPQLFYFSQN